MPLRGLLRSDTESDIREDDFVEVDHQSTHDASAVPIRIAKVDDYADIEPVQKLVREGNIVLVKIKGLKQRDMGELKRAVQRLRKTVVAVNGDIAGVDENFILATPNFARIDRTGEEEETPTSEATKAQQRAQKERSQKRTQQ